jgi:hypothetical protein
LRAFPCRDAMRQETAPTLRIDGEARCSDPCDCAPRVQRAQSEGLLLRLWDERVGGRGIDDRTGGDRASSRRAAGLRIVRAKRERAGLRRAAAGVLVEQPRDVIGDRESRRPGCGRIEGGAGHRQLGSRLPPEGRVARKKEGDG